MKNVKKLSTIFTLRTAQPLWQLLRTISKQQIAGSVFLSSLMSSLFLSCLFLISNSATALEVLSEKAQSIYQLSYGSALSPNHTFSHADKDWITYIEEKSQGRLKIKPFWAGTLISGENNVFELRHGVTDIAMITPIYMRAGMHAIRAQTGFYAGAEKIETQIEVYRCLMKTFPIFDKELDGIKVLVVQGGTASYILTRNKPIHSLKDIAGLRLRAPTALVSVVYELGGDAILMPMGDVYPAFAKGILDGVLTPEDTLKSMHFAEIGRYLNQVAMHRGGYPSRGISKKSWDQLPQDLQKILEESGRYWETRITHYILEGNKTAIEYGKAEGVQFVPFAREEQLKFNQLYNQLALDSAKELDKYGIQGEMILRHVNQLIASSEDGKVTCK